MTLVDILAKMEQFLYGTILQMNTLLYTCRHIFKDIASCSISNMKYLVYQTVNAINVLG